MAKHGLRELFSVPRTTCPSEHEPSGFRTALEELGPTFAKLGQICRPGRISSRLPSWRKLATLQDNVPP